MILWTRWGIVVVVLGFLGIVVSDVTLPDRLAGVGLLFGAVLIFAFGKWLLPRLDAPKPMMVTQPAHVDAQGQNVPAQQVQAVGPNGAPVFVQPRSTLFFIPFNAWPYLVAMLGVLVLIFPHQGK